MHCWKCGADLGNETRFCISCGTLLQPAEATAASLDTASGESSYGGHAHLPAQSHPALPGHPSALQAVMAAPQAMGAIRHPKETAYFTLAVVASVVAWSALAFFVILIGIVLAVPLLVLGWLGSQMLRAKLYGNAVRVGPSQYPEIHRIVVEFSRRLGIASPPEVFIINGQGAVNAMAIRVLRGRYILLLSDLVDLMMASGSYDELASVIGHELGHHALGHTNPWKSLLLWPSQFVPFLGPAYSRACELSADRASLWLTGSLDAVRLGIASLASGSHTLARDLNLESFRRQEAELGSFFAFLNDLFSTHPRLTKRLVELEAGRSALLMRH